MVFIFYNGINKQTNKQHEQTDSEAPIQSFAPFGAGVAVSDNDDDARRT